MCGGFYSHLQCLSWTSPKGKASLQRGGAAVAGSYWKCNVEMLEWRGKNGDYRVHDSDDWLDDDDSEMVPPHEYLACEYAWSKKSSGASVFEGVGRTLKGRDMSRIRDAVWSQNVRDPINDCDRIAYDDRVMPSIFKGKLDPLCESFSFNRLCCERVRQTVPPRLTRLSKNSYTRKLE
ncbi:hypothetical protein F3Y22_tig00110647pilonHSYRG00146 [Hibiscus syriacus]|uniref:Uncharacterized protein n=1 Tax=Hibiscus syriacus TaxID=106335 RepID=A0A6A2ZY31_HIBSY|nr:hypothetical protein F3Y22_tig00110647pilonHSYRG00146 [Hibiscus syriacus]